MKPIHIILLILAFMLIVTTAVEYQFNRSVDFLSLIAANTALIEKNQRLSMENRELITRMIDLELVRYEGRKR